ncbi:MAG: bifunctional oligoribonuclease/PAP phosphatase NrnA [Tepidisphaeraceae bacterium]|jgi:phosphoesterase RecJ-like protein
MTDQYQQIIDTLSSCRRVLVTTHIRPDGDALGCSAAMALAMRAKGIDAHVMLLSHLPTKYAFIFRDNNIAFTNFEKDGLAAFDLSGFDALLVVDTGTWSQLPGLEEKFAAWTKPILVVDHHLTQEAWGGTRLVVAEAAAAGEIVADIIRRWAIPLDKAIATCLYAAIVTDTGWFQFSNTRPFTHRLCATLMEAGVDTDAMYQAIYQNERAERVALQTRAMQSMKLLAGGKLAVMSISKKDFAETGASVAETENMVNIPLQIGDVQVSVLATEPRDFGPVRVSLRSKGQVDVAKFAELFGGGGHARASGLKVEAPLDEVCKRVIDAMLPRL